jgi:hypothetical protein
MRNKIGIVIVLISLLLLVSLQMFAAPITAHAVPNLVGQWNIQSKVACYENIFDPNDEPVFDEWSAMLVITVQNGSVFAGYIDAGDYKIKVTGAIAKAIARAIAPYYKVKMQLYGDNNRDFFSGELIGIIKIIGLANSFEEVTLAQMPSICTANVVATKVQSSSHFPGVWKGTSVIDGKEQQTTLTLDSALKGKVVNVIISSSSTYTHNNISGTESNGTLYFDLPLSNEDQGNPDCVNWNMSCSATLSQNFTAMTLSCSGTACGSGGGQPMNVTLTLTKQ